MNKKTSYKYGISLITLAITIVVMLILASAVILSLNNSKMVQNTEDAKFKYEVEGMKERYEAIHYDLMYENGGDETLLSDSDFENKGIISADFNNRFKVTKDGIIYFGDNDKEIEILEEMDITIE